MELLFEIYVWKTNVDKLIIIASQKAIRTVLHSNI